MLWITLAFIAGYVAAVLTWDRLHVVIIGAEEKAQKLRARARALEQKWRGA